MNHDHEHGVPSTAAISGHPIHPMLVAFPVAFIVGLLASDIVYAVTRDPFWARASWWLALCGVITGVLAAIFGATDLFTIPRARALTIGWVHGLGNLIAVVVTLINLILVSGQPARVPTVGLVLAAISVAIFLVTGWLGGELSYRHGIGVNLIEEPRDRDRRTGTV